MKKTCTSFVELIKPKWQKILMFFVMVLIFNFAQWDFYIMATATEHFDTNFAYIFIVLYVVLSILLYLFSCYLINKVIGNREVKFWEISMFIGTIVGLILGLSLFSMFLVNNKIFESLSFMSPYIEYLMKFLESLGLNFGGINIVQFYMLALIIIPSALLSAIGTLIGKAVQTKKGL